MQNSEYENGAGLNAVWKISSTLNTGFYYIVHFCVSEFCSDMGIKRSRGGGGGGGRMVIERNCQRAQLSSHFSNIRVGGDPNTSSFFLDFLTLYYRVLTILSLINSDSSTLSLIYSSSKCFLTIFHQCPRYIALNKVRNPSSTSAIIVKEGKAS